MHNIIKLISIALLLSVIISQQSYAQSCVQENSAGAGVRIYISSLSISNMHASQGTRVDVLAVPLSGTANTAVNCQNATTGAAARCAISGYTSTN